ncbi:MAG: gliding motility-associated C-terminal domain-containing protein, partial [Chitinophagaceae bacterium]
NTKVQIGTGVGTFSQNVTGLSVNTKYYVRAYAINGAGTGYGSMDSFTTTNTSVPTITIVGTLGVFKTCFGTESALDSFIVSGSNLTAGIAINAPSGFEISSIPALGFSANFSLGQSQGTSPSTIVYVRLKSNATGAPFGVITLTSAGAANKNLVAAGNVAGKPTITLGSISSVLTTDTSFNINYTSALGGPNQYSIVTDTPNAMPSFTAVNNATFVSSPIKVTIPASAANVYNFNLTVKNSNTGCISSVIGVNLNVIPAISPIISTTSATLIGITNATLGGNVSDSGTATVTERGVVFATTVNPTTANTKVTIGSGLGNFSQNITALTPNTTYHYRAYAINSVGTSYGADSVFTTLPNPEFNKNITNAFSPDGNGTNDTWVIDNADMLDGHEITVYNIFGQ